MGRRSSFARHFASALALVIGVPLLVPIVADAAPVRCLGKRATIIGHNRTEKIRGTTGDDVIVAKGGGDTINARGGDDIVCSGRGADNVSGGGGNDILVGNAGPDRIAGGPGEIDIVMGGGGPDRLSGGKGILDVVVYLLSPAPVTVDLVAGSASGEGSDLLFDLEGVVGSSFGDEISGPPLSVLVGSAGNDTLSGDRSLATFFLAPQAITIDLASGQATGEGTDQLVGSPGVIGSEHNDSVTGSAGPDIVLGWGGSDVIDGASGDDYLSGNEGNDQLLGGGGHRDALEGGPGNDTLDGGAGDSDSATFLGALGGVTATTDVSSGSGLGTDALSGIESLQGGPLDDHLTGDSRPNEIRGEGGNDVVSGAAGADFLQGNDGDDSLSAGLGDDIAHGGEGTDSIDGGDGIDTCESAEQTVGCEGGASPLRALPDMHLPTSVPPGAKGSPRGPAELESLQGFQLNVGACQVGFPFDSPSVLANAPRMWALYDTTGRPGQAVYWRSHLWRYNTDTGEWYHYHNNWQQTPWESTFARNQTDSFFDPGHLFSFNFGGIFTTLGQLGNSGFQWADGDFELAIFHTGYYAVSIEMFWEANAFTQEGSAHEWAPMQSYGSVGYNYVCTVT